MKTMGNTSAWSRRRFPSSRYHIRAWGSDRWPDLNYETDELPASLHYRYPCVDISRLDAVPLSSLKDNRHGQV